MAKQPDSSIRTHCARMDHGGCTVRVGLRDGRVESIRPEADGCLNQGYICPKASAAAEKLNHPERLTRPLRRIGTRGQHRWQEISWDEALDQIATSLQELKDRAGARSVAFCQGMPKGLEHFALIRLANLFGSPNVVAVQDVCHAPREIAGKLTCGFYPVPDYAHAGDCLLLWGSNPLRTNEEGQICSRVISRLKAGNRLIVVDPLRTRLAEKADVWLQLRPGSDNALALAFLHVLIEEELFDREFVQTWCSGFSELAGAVAGCSPEAVQEQTWVPGEQVRRAARLYAGAQAAALGWGNPIEQHVSTFQTCRALICLMALSNNLDRPGGNIQAVEPPLKRFGEFVRADRLPDKPREMLNRHHGAAPGLMTVPGAFFRRAVLEHRPYPVRGAFIQGSNPLMTYADSKTTLRALSRLDFLAVSDIFLTPTACLADVVLPAATHLEIDDIGHYGLGHGLVLARPKAVAPPEGCWPDLKILNELGKRLGSETDWFADSREMLDLVLEPSGLDFRSLAERGWLTGRPRFFKYRQDGFKTPSSKVELALSQAEKLDLPSTPGLHGRTIEPDAEYPLVLTCSKSPNFLHSSYRWLESLRRREPQPRTLLHPSTASEFGIQDGSWLSIETRQGRIRQQASLTDRIAPGVVLAAYGWWFPESGPERMYDWDTANYNILTSIEPLGKEFGTPNLKGLACRIAPAEPVSDQTA